MGGGLRGTIFSNTPILLTATNYKVSPDDKVGNTTPATIEAGHLWVVGIAYLFLAIHSWLVWHYIYIVKSNLWLVL